MLHNLEFARWQSAASSWLLIAAFAVLTACLLAWAYARHRAAVYALMMERICRAYNTLCRERKSRLFARLGDQFPGRRFIRVLELGSGTGANFEFMMAGFPGQIFYSAVDPCREAQPYLMTKSLLWSRIRLERYVTRAAEDLGDLFPEGYFDAVVATFVLCTVQKPDRVLAEVARVLKPNGIYIFLEHITSSRSWVRRVQAFFQPLWSVVFCDCRLLNNAEQFLRAASFNRLELTRDTNMPNHALLIQEQIEGCAYK